MIFPVIHLSYVESLTLRAPDTNKTPPDQQFRTTNLCFYLYYTKKMSIKDNKMNNVKLERVKSSSEGCVFEVVTKIKKKSCKQKR